MTHVCVSKLTIIVSDNGLSPDRRQAIIWTNAGILLDRPSGTNFSRNCKGNSYIFIQENALENIVWEPAAILSRPQYVNNYSQICQGQVIQWRLKTSCRPIGFFTSGRLTSHFVKLFGNA